MKTKKLITTYDKFDVVLVPFPFIDSDHTKKRPALVISSSEHFNLSAGASVMAMITTASHHPWPLDVLITDLKQAGLQAASIIRIKLFTLDHRLILKKIGRLNSIDQKSVDLNFKSLFRL